jgi:hypothetical protein
VRQKQRLWKKLRDRRAVGGQSRKKSGSEKIKEEKCGGQGDKKCEG